MAEELMFAIIIRIDVIDEVTFLATLTHRCGSGARSACGHLIACLHGYHVFAFNLGTEKLDIVVAYDDPFNASFSCRR